jgi:ABC-type branched-subunit amino acid transport system substrate-binding protein
MKRRSWRKPVAVACAAAFVLAACGDDDDSSGATTAAPAATAGAATTAGGATTSAGGATTTEGGATTTEGGATTTEGATTGSSGGAALDYTKMGLIDGVYQRDDFKLDPKDCPEDWNPKQGITDTDITFFSSVPKSGPLAGFGLIGDGIQSYFNYINETKGGVDGKKLHMEFKDDAYAPDKTKTNVDEALGENKYAGAVTIIGTPNNLAVWDELNDECMPQLLNGSGYPGWGDVANHPWTTGHQLDYASEAGIWAEWLKKNHPEAKKVAAITFNNDFGKTYVTGFKKAIEGSDIQVVDQEFHEPTAPDIKNQFTTAAASGADVLLLETTGTFCTQGMAEVEKSTWKPIVIASGTCTSLTQFFQPLIDQGLTGKDTHEVQALKDVNDPKYADDPIVKLFHETVKAQGLDDTQSTIAQGWWFALTMVNILEEAAKYQGGIDRGNIALAARFIDYNNPFVFDGIRQQTNGFKDAYLNEGGQMGKYTITDPKQLGSFQPDGDLIDNNGKLGNFDDFQKAAAGG